VCILTTFTMLEMMVKRDRWDGKWGLERCQ